jgi:type III secretory pathway component EscR
MEKMKTITILLAVKLIIMILIHGWDEYDLSSFKKEKQ